MDRRQFLAAGLVAATAPTALRGQLPGVNTNADAAMKALMDAFWQEELELLP